MRASTAPRIQLFPLLTCAWLCACSQTPESRGDVPSPDGVEFVSDVYPVLLRDCAFSTCHGAPERFFQVYGPGRTRLDEETAQDDPMLLVEVLHSYERARSMLSTAADPRQSLLLRKPLDTSEGGQGHLGAGVFGRNVYRSKDNPRYEILRQWVVSTGSAPEQEDVDAANDAASAASAEFIRGAL